MFLYITSGTPDYMERIKEKYKSEEMFLLYSVGSTLLLHESIAKSKFSTPRTYKVIASKNKLEQRGYFVNFHIPVDDDAKPIFEKLIESAFSSIEKEPGFIAYRLLKPYKTDTYIVLTQWTGLHSYEAWKNSRSYKELEQSTAFSEKQQNIFDAATYVTTYSGAKEKQKEE